jgi:hypothetical protein
MATNLNARLFRNNQGRAWTGKIHKLPDGSILIKEPRPINFGLSVGSGDLIGGTQIVVTPEMVGRKIFVFTNYEGKTKNTRTTTEQQNFHKMVTSLGGLSIIEKFSDETDTLKSELPSLIKKFQGV